MLREARAKALCHRCVVCADCLAAGQSEEGIWGGMTDSERRRATQRSRYSPPRFVSPNATTGGSVIVGWAALEAANGAVLCRRDSATTWHGSEFMVVKNNVIIKVTDDLTDAYTTYARVIG